MRKFLLLLFLGFFTGAIAQVDSEDLILPRGFAPGEKEMMRDYISDIQNRSQTCITMPPDASVRSIAEWEELQSVVITWTSFTGILTEIVRHAREEVEVIIICNNENVVKNQLGGAGVDWTSNVTFIEKDFDSIWVRDYGPNSVYLDDVGELVSVDWIYNRPRPDDDKVPEAVAEYLEIDNYCTTVAPLDMVHTGGNYMTDGLGTAFSSNLVLEENGPNNEWGTSNHSEEAVSGIIDDFMGITNYPMMEALPWDVIHHIDMHMKLLDEETILVGEYPEGVADGPQIEANIQYILDNYTTAYGDPFKIVRIPMPPDANDEYPDYPGNQWWEAGDYRTYANAIFLNKTILVPVYEEEHDTTALRIWEENMPGYNIVGIDCNDIIPSLGAIHCITKEVGVFNPLWITTNKIDEGCLGEDANVTAQIKHSSGIESATLHYQVDGGDWISLTMNNTEADFWSADIPEQGEGAVVSYYIESTATDGKTITRPLPGAEGPFGFEFKSCVVSSDDLLRAATTLEEIFPNPASAITCIPVQAERSLNASIEVTDVLGRHIETVFEGQLPSGASKYFIQAERYQAGTYFVTLKTNEFAQTQKLIVK